jgi:uncharacterized protein
MMMTKIPTGRFVWFEHVSKDPSKAQGFLGELFNWSTAAMPMPGGGAYAMIKLGDVSLGGYPPLPAGVEAPAHWVSHLQVASAIDTAKQVESLGGKVLVAPIDMGMGSYALVADPLGGVFALWQPAKPEGTGDFRDQPGAFCWNELFTDDPAKSVAFYQAIGGFDVKVMDMPGMPAYHVLESEGKPRGGILKNPMPGVPQMWLPYVQVERADATHERAKKLGGGSTVPPTDIPGVGRFAIVSDPVGAQLGILQATPKS